MYRFNLKTYTYTFYNTVEKNINRHGSGDFKH